MSLAPYCRGFPRCLAPIAFALIGFLSPQVRADPDQGIDVSVRMQGEEVFVDVTFHVPVTPQAAWAVMTDYDHATEFISKLEKSVILSRTSDTLLVAQKGSMGWGPFSVLLETVTEVHLIPYEMLRGRMVSGNMKKNESTTRLIADATGTRVVYHLESIPEVWIPPLIGRAMVEMETRARFKQLVEEILRRKALAEVKR
jgi:hypothetical protein